MIIKFEELSKSNLIQDAIYKGGSQGHAGDEPLIHLFRLEGLKKGIGVSGGFRKSNKESNGKVQKGSIAFVALVDTGKQKEWPNVFNEETRVFTYYGDNRVKGKDLLETKHSGNELLEEIFTKSYGTPDDRKSIPPIFVFKSIGEGRDTRFIGLAVPGVKGKDINESLELKDFGTYKNYVAHFTVLDISEGVIKREWLKDLKNNISLSYEAPKEWNEYIINGVNGVTHSISYQGIEIKEEKHTTYNNEIERKIKVRVTQGKFRDSILKRDKVCVICGLDISELLVASHIKPWSESSDFEKIDEENGLLLCINHDALFDKGYISFDEGSNIIISDKIDESTYEKLNINKDIQLNLNQKQSVYMKYHRNIILK